MVDFQVKAGLLADAIDPNIECYAEGRRAWVSVCSVLCFYNQNIRRSTSDPRRLVVFVSHSTVLTSPFLSPSFLVSKVAVGMITFLLGIRNQLMVPLFFSVLGLRLSRRILPHLWWSCLVGMRLANETLVR